MTYGESQTTTPYAVHCREDGLVYMTTEEYNRQMSRPDDLWRCPRCGATATFSDDVYEEAIMRDEERFAMLKAEAELDAEGRRDEAADREFDLRREERGDVRGFDD